MSIEQPKSIETMGESELIHEADIFLRELEDVLKGLPAEYSPDDFTELHQRFLNVKKQLDNISQKLEEVWAKKSADAKES